MKDKLIKVAAREILIACLIDRDGLVFNGVSMEFCTKLATAAVEAVLMELGNSAAEKASDINFFSGDKWPETPHE